MCFPDEIDIPFERSEVVPALASITHVFGRVMFLFCICLDAAHQPRINAYLAVGTVEIGSSLGFLLQLTTNICLDVNRPQNALCILNLLCLVE